ncbi:hypothetical protein C2G38_1394836 [Gigaspora rosea]|uniref:Attractin/MKLN-like beta-propeller domain-containing protein n=1 Tax=Gigaspora rosea TaxID=44941 RepID=A0A397V5Y8_9GLOM|nr:hypothetical protein C2G38_1394836 [Gigaspora rosea]
MRFFQIALFSFLLQCSLFFLVTCLKGRSGQTSVLVGTKLYFFGGKNLAILNVNKVVSNITNEVWYLDLSNSSLFDTATPIWYQDVGMPRGVIMATSCVSLTNNSAVFLIGGRQYLSNSNNISFNSPIFRFDLNNNSLWTIPNITNFNNTFKTRNLIQAVIDKKGKVFIFGGRSYFVNDSDNSPIMYYNDMNIVDINTMSWSTLVIPQAPKSFCYTATLLQTGLIIYIGGVDYNISSGITLVNMSEIRIFDTTNYIWFTKTASGSFIGGRIGHTAVLDQNGNIIIYGGSISIDNVDGLPSFPHLAILNTSTWVWSIPDISPSNTPNPLTFHSAAFYKNYMVIAFGKCIIIMIYFDNKNLL